MCMYVCMCMYRCVTFGMCKRQFVIYEMYMRMLYVCVCVCVCEVILFSCDVTLGVM